MNLERECRIEQLSAKDIGLMRSVLNLFGEVFQEKETYCRHQPDDAYLESLLSKDHFIVLAARISHQIVGGLAAYELHKFEQQRSEIYIYDLAIDESFRRQGIATQLINELRRESERRGAYVIFVQADYGDGTRAGLRFPVAASA